MVTRSRIGGLFIAMLAISMLAISGTATANGILASDYDRHSDAHQQVRTVTLVSGDRVTVLGDGSIAVSPRAGVSFMTQKTKGHHYVIPTDALPLLRADRLDKRLFDVTALLDAGYDKRSYLPLIVSGTAKAPAGLTASKRLPLAKGLAAKAPVGKLAEVWKGLKGAKASAYEKLWLDGMRKPSLDVSVPQIGAPAAWASGLDGTGVKVAVLDTGIDPAHPDMLGKILAEKNFGSEYEDALDRVGHGTHVASTIAGTGAASGGKYKGVAPGASLLDGKVCVEFGCAESWILDGMQWAADNGAQVVNMSLGGGDGPEIDPIEQAVNDLTASHGMLFVIAAGNSGYFGDETLSSPASADAALAVGAVDKSDVLARFSSKGPRVGDGALKPEITGPGVDIVAANSKDGFLGKPGESYTTLSGTSMATPHVAGAAAILTQQHPTWTAEQRKSALTGAANPNATDGPFAQGAGRVDIARATTQKVTPSLAAVSFGRQAWPHDDDAPDARTVTYHNSGTADVTLQLALNTSAPAGVFTLSASTVTVPAGGDASVTLTSDTRNGGSTTGYLHGRVVATAEGVRVQTPFAVERESERFTINLNHLGRGGTPADFFITSLTNLDTWKMYEVWSEDPNPSLRMPAGDYLLSSDAIDDDNLHVDIFVQPVLTVSGDQTLTLDAAKTKSYALTVDDPAAEMGMFAVGFDYVWDNGGYGSTFFADSPDQLSSLQLGPTPVAGFASQVHWEAHRPGLEGTWRDSKTVYLGAWEQQGSMHDGFSKHLTKKDFARIEESYRASGSKAAIHVRFGMFEGRGVGVGMEFKLPFQREVFVTTGNWDDYVDGYAVESPTWDDYPVTLLFNEQSYVAGQRVTHDWNRAVAGPAFAKNGDDILRYQDQMYVGVPAHSDGQGHRGVSDYTSASTALYRNGELVQKVDEPYAYVEGLPKEKARYRVESMISRGAPFALSTKVHSVWEFNSEYSEGFAPAPVTALSFAPALDEQNSARTRQVMAVPVHVGQQEGAQPLQKLTIQVSTDDGATWRTAPVVNIFGKTFVVITNPAKAGFVSLRAQAEDRGGNTVDQTIIRAYAVR